MSLVKPTLKSEFTEETGQLFASYEHGRRGAEKNGINVRSLSGNSYTPGAL